MAENETKPMNTTKQKETQGAEKLKDGKAKIENQFKETITVERVN